MGETPPTKIKQISDFHNAIIIKMRPKLSKLELHLFSIIDGVCKGNRKNKTCGLSIEELSRLVAQRMPHHSVNSRSVRIARKKLLSRGLLLKMGKWNRHDVITTMVPTATLDGFKGIQIPIEASANPRLNNAAKMIFGRIHYLLSTNGRVYLEWTNSELAADLNLGMHKIKQALTQLKEQNYIFTPDSGTRWRRIALNPDWKDIHLRILSKFERVSKYRTVYKSDPVKRPTVYKSDPVKSLKATMGVDLRGANKLKDNKYHPTDDANPPGFAGRSNNQMEVCMEPTRAVQRVIDHWNSKNPPLQRSIKNKSRIAAEKVVAKTLRSFAEVKIKECIDLYHTGVHDPRLRLGKKNKSAPGRVGLAEFFEFSAFTTNLIHINKISGFEGVNSWFEICLKGYANLENRFLLVRPDRYPIVTSILKRELRSWPHPPNLYLLSSKNMLCKISERIVQYHQEIRPRLIMGGITKVSVPAFVTEHLLPHLQNLDKSGFRLYFMVSDNFFDNLTHQLEDMGFLSRPVFVRNLKRRDGSDKVLPQRSGSRKIDNHRNDNEYELSPADF